MSSGMPRHGIARHPFVAHTLAAPARPDRGACVRTVGRATGRASDRAAGTRCWSCRRSWGTSRRTTPTRCTWCSPCCGGSARRPNRRWRRRRWRRERSRSSSRTRRRVPDSCVGCCCRSARRSCRFPARHHGRRCPSCRRRNSTGPASRRLRRRRGRCRRRRRPRRDRGRRAGRRRCRRGREARPGACSGGVPDGARGRRTLSFPWRFGSSSCRPGP